MQPAVFVANDYIVGPLRSGLEEQTQADGGFGEIEFQLRGIGVRGLQRGEQRRAATLTGAYSWPALSTRRASRGEGVKVASLGRLGDVVVSSKRVRRVTR